MDPFLRRVESLAAQLASMVLLVGGGVAVVALFTTSLGSAGEILGGTILLFMILIILSLLCFYLQMNPPANHLIRWMEAIGAASVAVGSGVVLYSSSAFVWNVAFEQSVSYFDLMVQWDAGWYAGIVTEGYDTRAVQSGAAAGQANWAFFPLYPLLVWGVKTVFGVGVYVAGTLVSVLALLIGCIFGYRYLVRTRSRRVARLGVGLLAIGPYSFYAYTVYTEALFICLICIGFWALSTERYVGAAITGGVLSATRSLGVLFGVAILFHLLLHADVFEPLRMRVLSPTETISGEQIRRMITDRRVLSLGLVPVGLVAFMSYLWWHTGDPLAFVTIQSAWGRSFGNPITRSVSNLLYPSLQTQYLAATAILALAVAFDLIRRRRPVEGGFTILLVLIPLSSGLTSIPRYAFGTAVLVFAAGDWVQKLQPYHTIVFGVLVAMNFISVILWYTRHHIVA